MKKRTKGEKIGACIAAAKVAQQQALIDSGKMCANCLRTDVRMVKIWPAPGESLHDHFCETCAVQLLVIAVDELRGVVGEAAAALRLTFSDGYFPLLQNAERKWAP